MREFIADLLADLEWLLLLLFGGVVAARQMV
jgi:hypothetical protein